MNIEYGKLLTASSETSQSRRLKNRKLNKDKLDSTAQLTHSMRVYKIFVLNGEFSYCHTHGIFAKTY
jgi:hypothetical protein